MQIFSCLTFLIFIVFIIPPIKNILTGRFSGFRYAFDTIIYIFFIQIQLCIQYCISNFIQKDLRGIQLTNS
ncbi:MAG: hypothetical protein CVU39_27480 [Chloroflexi bacterium HGW-Chloroflexi-10]|nr:MAG: hypothetical protein CVU39_27480 [Chloroflexi bacterium HGW-Chloroflexi-10]